MSLCARRGEWRFYNTTSKRRRDLRPLAVDTALIGNVLSVCVSLRECHYCPGLLVIFKCLALEQKRVFSC